MSDTLCRACANTKQNTKYRTRRQVQHIHKFVQQDQNTQNSEARTFIVQQSYSFSTTELSSPRAKCAGPKGLSTESARAVTEQ